ncbi:hypothetical protein EB796_021551 [Bugula neritina]|uniref:Uncharacterized protein n=1 Tax=Bugula neritina TaxID=10212 RepID=A0A7J7J444_BUGNE|nr:hypothetical protein EB796_021551 [Bugula neritina]
MWFNQDSRKIVKKQRSLYNRFKKTGDPFDHKLYAQYRKQAKKDMRQHKQAYSDQVSQEYHYKYKTEVEYGNHENVLSAVNVK